jgi:GNAT superfamily N-acetyltransferase
VSNSISTPEFKPRTIEHFVDRINNVTSEKLPYIVAIAKGNRPKEGQQYVSERIVGFAFLDDFCDKGSSFRYTFELELYVHPGYLQKGIAKCLLDRLLSTVSTGYQPKGGYQWVNQGEYLKHDAERVVKTINVSVPHESKDGLEWLSKFLKEFKFAKAGHFKSMGVKLNKM